jgi:2-oxoglutarate ferredoxin oxidoreductase subunit gamma
MPSSSLTEIRFAGFGGQGIIRSGIIIGKAVSIFDKKFATMNQSFGPEARGGACSAQVVVSGERVLYPYVTTPHVLVAMSQEAFSRYEPELREGGLLIIDQDLVKPGPVRKGVTLYGVPATRIAEELGNRIIANVAMLGFFTAVTGVVTARAMREALPSLVPERFLKMNLKAFDQGYRYGQQVRAGEKKPAEKSRGGEKKPPAAAGRSRAGGKKSGAASKKTGAAGKKSAAAGKKSPATAKKRRTAAGRKSRPGKRSPRKG